MSAHQKMVESVLKGDAAVVVENVEFAFRHGTFRLRLESFSSPTRLDHLMPSLTSLA